jgi:hypothetical protein
VNIQLYGPVFYLFWLLLLFDRGIVIIFHTVNHEHLGHHDRHLCASLPSIYCKMRNGALRLDLFHLIFLSSSYFNPCIMVIFYAVQQSYYCNCLAAGMHVRLCNILEDNHPISWEIGKWAWIYSWIDLFHLIFAYLPILKNADSGDFPCNSFPLWGLLPSHSLCTLGGFPYTYLAVWELLSQFPYSLRASLTFPPMLSNDAQNIPTQSPCCMQTLVHTPHVFEKDIYALHASMKSSYAPFYYSVVWDHFCIW